MTLTVYQRPTSVFGGIRQLTIFEKGYPKQNMHPTLRSKSLEKKYVFCMFYIQDFTILVKVWLRVLFYNSGMINTFFSISIVRMASRRQNNCASSFSGSWSVNIVTMRLFQFFKCCIGLCSGFNCNSITGTCTTLYNLKSCTTTEKDEKITNNIYSVHHVEQTV